VYSGHDLESKRNLADGWDPFCVLLKSQGHMDAESKGRVWIDDDDSDDDDSDDDDDELQRYTMQNVNIRNRSNP
jgi:hypothetical protein